MRSIAIDDIFTELMMSLYLRAFRERYLVALRCILDEL